MSIILHDAPTVNPTPADDDTADRLAWLNDSPDNEIDEYPGPGWDAEPYEPDEKDSLHRLGYDLGSEGEDPAEPAGLAAGELRSFRTGLAEGRRRREREQAEHDARVDRLHERRMEEAFGEPGAGWPAEERVRAVGSIRAREA